MSKRGVLVLYKDSVYLSILTNPFYMICAITMYDKEEHE